MISSLVRIGVLSKRNMKEILRDPLSISFLIFLPLLMEILFYLMFHNLTSQFEMRYLAPGIVVFSQSFLSLFIGLLISLDRASAFLNRLYISKAKSYEYIFGYILSMLPIVVVQSILFFVVAGIFDVTLYSLWTIVAILLSIFTSMFYISIGILIGSICREKSIGGVASVVVMCQSILSGMWFPVDGLGSVMQTIMKCLPFKNSVDVVGNALNGNFADILIPAVIVFSYSVLSILLATIAFKKHQLK